MEAILFEDNSKKNIFCAFFVLKRRFAGQLKPKARMANGSSYNKRRNNANSDLVEKSDIFYK
jgi:hypothetical protein